MITLTIPNDDHIALRAFGKALEEMALAHGAPLRINPHVSVEKLREAMKNAEPTCIIPEVDTTAQQVETLATHVITSQEKDGDPVDLDNGNISQGYRIEVEELTTTDSTGTPWDERIHSASKALNADGTWRLRRKPKDVDETEWAALVESVKAELTYREQLKEETEQSFADEFHIDPAHQEGGTTAELTIEPPVTPPGDDFHTDAGVVTEQTVAGIPPIPVPPVATGAMLDALAEIPVAPPLPHTIPVPVSDEQAWDFPKLMKFLTERHGKIDVPTVNTLLAVDGLAALTDLNAHPDKIGPFVARVKAHLGE